MKLAGGIFGAACVLTSLLSVAPVAAQDACPNEANAGVVYGQGAQALAEGRYNDAARKFAEADSLCPHEVALGEAFRAVEAADNPIFCMELIERAERRDVLPAERAQLKLKCETKVGQIVVRCPGSTCQASIDGQPVKLHETTWVLNGEHVVDLKVDGGPVRPHRVVVRPGEVTHVPVTTATPSPLPPPLNGPEPHSPDSGSAGLPPAVFFVGLGLTAVAGAALLWSGVDTIDQNDNFKNTADASARSDGLDAQLRTNVLIGVTAGFSLATIAVALFTDWGGEEVPGPVTIQLDSTGRAGLATWRGSF